MFLNKKHILLSKDAIKFNAYNISYLKSIFPSRIFNYNYYKQQKKTKKKSIITNKKNVNIIAVESVKKYISNLSINYIYKILIFIFFK